VLQRNVNGWTVPVQSILYNGYGSNLNDYLYVKVPGNSTSAHGIALITDNAFYYGRDNRETGAITNDANAPLNESVGMKVSQAGQAYFKGKVGINTFDPDSDGYSFAEDLVINGGNSASDGVGITLAGNGKRYGVIAFGDAADNNAGEIWYDHDNNSMNFRTAGTLQVSVGSTGNLDIKNGDLKIGNTSVIDSSRNLTNIGTISSGTISTSGNFSGVHASSPTLELKDTTNNVRFLAYAQDSNAFVGTHSSHNLNIGTNNTAAMSIDTSQNVTFSSYIKAGSEIRMTGSTGVIRGDQPFSFVTISGDAQNVRTKSVFAGSTYGDTPPAGSVNATNTYELNGTTVIDSSRNLTNIGTISAGTITSTADSSNSSEGGQLVLRANSGGAKRYSIDVDSSNRFRLIGEDDATASNGFIIMRCDAASTIDFHRSLQMGGTTFLDTNRNLSNIGTISSGAITAGGDILPSSNDTYDLGSTANAWKELHVEDIRFHNASGAVGGIGQYNTGGDIEILSDHNIVFKETDAGTIKAVFGMNGPNFTFGQSSENTSYRVYVNGSIASTADVTAYASDERLKTNIVEIDSAIEKVKQLRGVTFDWQDDVEEKGFEPSAKHETGVIAQEVQKVIPDAVVPAPFDPEYWTVKHEKIIPLLIEAIKEQQKEIEQLKKHSHPAKDMCDMNGYEELVARIEKMEKNYGNN
jgi:hypothetical protein